MEILHDMLSQIEHQRLNKMIHELPSQDAINRQRFELWTFDIWTFNSYLPNLWHMNFHLSTFELWTFIRWTL